MTWQERLRLQFADEDEMDWGASLDVRSMGLRECVTASPAGF